VETFTDTLLTNILRNLFGSRIVHLIPTGGSVDIALTISSALVGRLLRSDLTGSRARRCTAEKTLLLSLGPRVVCGCPAEAIFKDEVEGSLVGTVVALAHLREVYSR
jgi:hypothetical protein